MRAGCCSAVSCRRSKYTLRHVVRTNLAANDAAYGCVFETEDDSGVRGVKLSKELMSVAGVCACACRVR
jgi:3-ketoacyl-CoA synthase